MMDKSPGVTFQNLLPFILAILLIYLIPMLMRRYGLDWGDIVRSLFSRRGKQDYAELSKAGPTGREPWQSNGRIQDIQSLVSTLLIFVRRNKLGLVYPGTVEHGGKMANLVALLVTRGEVIGINCFGFGGTISEVETGWTQHMNGADGPIPDPLAGNRSQWEIVRRAMDGNNLSNVPLRVVAVFTSRTVTLQTTHTDEVFDTRGLIEHLRARVGEAPGALDPEAVARQLNACVKRLTK